MSHGTYVAHNAYFGSGGPLGILGLVPAAFIEAHTGQPFATLVDCLSGSSIGGVSAESLSIHASAVRIARSTYACSIDLFDRPSHELVRNQILNQKMHMHLLRDHYDHDILYRMLEPHYGAKTMNDATTSLLVSAHNMTKKRDELLGRLDSSLFDTGALRIPLVNGSTLLLDGAMATTSIPGVFHPHLLNGSHYRDNGTVVSAGQIHKELDAALKSKQKMLHDARDAAPLNRRGFLSFGFSRSAPGPRTLQSADNAVVRTIYLGTGDFSEMPYDHDAQLTAGFMATVSDREYSTLHAAKSSGHEQDRRDMERIYDPQTMAATGMPAITSINRSIVPRPGTDEMRKFPSSSPLDSTSANLHKVFYVAALNVADNLGKIAACVQEIATVQLAQGKINADGYRHLAMAAHRIATQDPWPMLEQIIVTDQNGPEIYRQFSQGRKRTAAPRVRLSAA